MSTKVQYPSDPGLVEYRTLKKGQVFFNPGRGCYGVVPTRCDTFSGGGMHPAVQFFPDGAICTTGVERDTLVRVSPGLNLEVKFTKDAA